MFLKELPVREQAVYLFSMEPAVASMADIFNRSSSHTEENNKQQAARLHMIIKDPPSQHKTHRPSLCFAMCCVSLQFFQIFDATTPCHECGPMQEPYQGKLPVFKPAALTHSGVCPSPALGSQWYTLEFTLVDDI